MPTLPATTFAALHRAHPERDFLLLSASISRKLHHELALLLAAERHHARCTIFLNTLGGDSDAGYRIARCLQEHYEHIRLVIPGYCKSAGTLIAIGAHELAIGDLGELGPLDMQIAKPTELLEHGSVLDITQALDAISAHTRSVFFKVLIEMRQQGHLSTRLAGELATAVATSVARPLYKQIDALTLGEYQRAGQIVKAYAERLCFVSKSLCENVIDYLIAAYPSHSFVIDRTEARELFNFVDCPSKEEAEICHILKQAMDKHSELTPTFIRENTDIFGGIV